jgi:nucleoside-diphosphate-sugar epimerase/acyl-CoA synthetase (AMP-forming)/AMP-acid ligase II
MGSTAYYVHSSGTTGVPKLIPQTHNGAVGILPLLQFTSKFGLRIATFTATPLYSGGIADLLRAWSAASPLWIFPEGHAPLIGSTILPIITQIDRLSQIHIEPTSWCKSPISKASTAGTLGVENAPPLSFENTGEVGDIAQVRLWRLGYFSCVPYVLENLVETPELKTRLLGMDAVGVGGAAMPKDLGDRLVNDGIRLVSRFGSSECGFLLSSAREYDKDKGWNVLRVPNTTGLEFKSLEGGDGKCELVVLENWPMVSIASHAGRPFNTHDVFIPNETTSGAWTYAGRSDTRITLKTGKKFDPVPIEDALRLCAMIEDAIVIGDDRPFAAAFIIPSSKYDSAEEEDRNFDIRERIKWVNRTNPSHAKIGEQCWIVLNHCQIGRVRRNPKGGVVRSVISSDFEEELEQIYGITNGPSEKEGTESTTIRSSEDVAMRIKSIVQDFFDRTLKVEDDFDFFDAGVDSAMSIQMRRRICNMLPDAKQKKVPLNVIYECGTVDLLIKFICELTFDPVNDQQRRTSIILEDGKRRKHQEMISMVERYVSRQPHLLDEAKSKLPRGFTQKSHDNQGIHILLTGATGFLGIHILNLLIHDPSVTRIFVCVRGSRLVPYEEQQQRAKTRIDSARALHQLRVKKCKEDDIEKIVYVPFFINEPDLGVPTGLYTMMVDSMTHVVHAAWEVNFNLPLKLFASQIEGTVNLFNLLLLSSQRNTNRPPSLLFCSSVASVANMSWSLATKPFSADPNDAAALGYGQSKWVVESVLRTLSERHPVISTSILRLGQLSGSTITGIWNRKEAWPLMIDASLNVIGKEDHLGNYTRRTSSTSGASTPTSNIVFPDLASTPEPPLDWLPVDGAARQIFKYIKKADGEVGSGVVQVANDGTQDRVTWSQAQSWILTWAKGRGLLSTVVSPERWLKELEASSVEHHAKALVSLWRKNWLRENAGKERAGDDVGRKDSKASSSPEINNEDGKLKGEGGLDREYVWRILDWALQCK